VEVGILLQHHAAVGVVLRQIVGPGADRLPVEREVLVGHAGLRVEHLGLPRHRRKERHRQPVDELRVLALDADAVGVAVDHLGAFEREIVQIQRRIGRVPGRFLQRFAQRLQADDVLAHQAEDRRAELGIGQPLDLVHIIGRHQFARAAVLEIADAVSPATSDGVRAW
jgi:hypothetical protein